MRLGAPIACVAATCLVFTGTAAAHVVAAPPGVTQGQRQTVTLVAPNERGETMSGLSVTVPPALTVVEAVPPGGGWEPTVEGGMVTWSGGSLVPGGVSSFSLVLDAPGEPGTVTIESTQLYPGGARVRTPVALTILPGEESSGSRGTVLLVAAVGLGVALTIVVVAWLRRRTRGSSR